MLPDNPHPNTAFPPLSGAIDHPDVTNPILSSTEVGAEPADPHLVVDTDGTWYLFFEEIPSGGEGRIGYATSTDGLSWTYQSTVFDPDFYIAYPYVFEYDGTWYMMPHLEDPDSDGSEEC